MPRDGLIPPSDCARHDQIQRRPTKAKRFSNRAGIVNFLGKAANIDTLFPGQGLDADKVTYQLSDHFPVWIQVNTDIDGDRLEQIVQDGQKLVGG